MRPSARRRRRRVLFGCAALAAYVFSLGLGSLAEPDEPRYAEIAREMLARGDWVTPTLNYVKYFEKPPLVYWLTALSFRVFGLHDWVARLVPVASAMVTLALTWLAGRRGYGPWVGFFGAALLATSPLFFGLGQTLTLDAPLAACITAALCGFWLGYRDPVSRRRWYTGVYLALALGVLVKGPVMVVLTGGVIGAFLLMQRARRAALDLLHPLGIMVFLAVALPWFVLVSLRNPEFPRFFIVDEHLLRFLASHEHHEPLWFFLPIVFAALVPWSVALVLVPSWWRAGLAPQRWSPMTRFCVTWAVVVVGFFSLSSSKLATYVLPALPPLALLSARALRRALQTGAPLASRLGLFFCVTGAAVLAGGPIAERFEVHWRVSLILPYLCASGLVMLATGMALRRSAGEDSLWAALYGTLALLSVAISGRDVTTSYADLSRAVQHHAGPTDRIVVYKHYVQAVPFYTRRRVVMVGTRRGELDFGSRQGDQTAFFWQEDELVAAWVSDTPLFLVINRDELDGLRPELAPEPIEIVAEGKKVVVVNRPLS